MNDQPYTQAVARLTVDGKSYTAALEIESTYHLALALSRVMRQLQHELELKEAIRILMPDYSQEPIYELEDIRDGTLEYGGIRSIDGEPFYGKCEPVKVVFLKQF